MRPSLPALLTAVERFARARGAEPATFAWNLAQGSVVPGPAELLFAPLAISEPRKAWRLAAAAAAGSILGGCLAYAIGHVAFTAVGRPVLEFLGVTDSMVQHAITSMTRYGWLFVLGSTLTPLSTKAAALGAGAISMPFPAFALALASGRIARFTLGAMLVRATSGYWLRLRQRLLAPRR
jgi:membrane protein YqaA with SNARE-associated domain